MVKVFRTSDRIPLKIGDAILTVAPLSYQQKMEIQGHAMMRSGDEIQNASDAMRKAIKYSLKKVEGMEYSDGSQFELEFTNEHCKELTDDCIDELLNTEITASLFLAISSLMQGIGNELRHPQTGKKIEGVELLPIEGGPKIKKKGRA